MSARKVVALVGAGGVVVTFGVVNMFGAAQMQTGSAAVALEFGKAAQQGAAQPCGPPAAPGGVVTAGQVFTGAVVDRNAQVVVAAGKAAGVPQAGIEVALGVILVESNGRNLASRKVPESMKYPNDGVAPGDHLSINAFQQQVGMGWFDTVAHGMQPPVAAASFFRHLKAIRGWQSMPFGTAAQAVQGSAFPGRYVFEQPAAQALYAKWSGTTTGPAPAGPVVLPAACTNPAPVAAGGGGAVAISGHWANPLKPAAYDMGSPFGPRRGKMHKGQDLPVKIGTPVHSVCDGTVITSEKDAWGGGLMVKTDCGGGVVAESMHNSRLIAKGGQVVKAGDLVALSGSTGNSSGPHVHIQIDVNGAPVDPVPWFKARGVPL